VARLLVDGGGAHPGRIPGRGPRRQLHLAVAWPFSCADPPPPLTSAPRPVPPPPPCRPRARSLPLPSRPLPAPVPAPRPRAGPPTAPAPGAPPAFRPASTAIPNSPCHPGTLGRDLPRRRVALLPLPARPGRPDHRFPDLGGGVPAVPASDSAFSFGASVVGRTGDVLATGSPATGGSRPTPRSWPLRRLASGTRERSPPAARAHHHPTPLVPAAPRVAPVTCVQPHRPAVIPRVVFRLARAPLFTDGEGAVTAPGRGRRLTRGPGSGRPGRSFNAHLS